MVHSVILTREVAKLAIQAVNSRCKCGEMGVVSIIEEEINKRAMRIITKDYIAEKKIIRKQKLIQKKC